MRSIAKLLGIVIAVPDFSTLSRRGEGMNLHAPSKTARFNPARLVVDCTGLKIFGEGVLSAACCACVCLVLSGLSKSIKPSENASLGASSTAVSIFSVARSPVRI
ncbi:MAG: transposase [Roseobacter sp.]